MLKLKTETMTAVQWLNEKLILKGIFFEFELLEQAKEMEKQQIIDAYSVGVNDGCSYMSDGKFEFKDAEQYYNQTYGSKGNETKQ